ncbi:MAG: SO_0444 family Cu/Zn efflux transporter [Planctomycetes bacterium]|nr:SO_0444 family Cu/Zn efflux transporter [Planctomycetota bacterium]
MPDNIVNTLLDLLYGSWLVLGQMAPYLLLGFLIAGILSVCVSPPWVEKHLGKRGLWQVIKASLLGVPLPLCSCGVIPVSVSLRQSGASRAATTAFLISTPQTGVDSIAVTYSMLGPVFAIFRPLVALITGIIGGALVQAFGEPNEIKPVEIPGGKSSPCCEDHCCMEEKPKANALARIFSHGFIALPRDIGPALLIGIIIAGGIAALVPEKSQAAYLGSGALSILLLMAAGVPVYVCATASVPIAAGLMHMGASPGAAVAFLIAGPATNAATFTTIWKALGHRTALLYLLTVAISAFAGGLLLDWLYQAFALDLPMLYQSAHGEHLGNLWLANLSAVVLLGVLLFSYLSSRQSSEN